MKCRSKFNYDQIYNYEIITSEKVKIFKDDVKIYISQKMFNDIFEPMIDFEE